MMSNVKIQAKTEPNKMNESAAPVSVFVRFEDFVIALLLSSMCY